MLQFEHDAGLDNAVYSLLYLPAGQFLQTSDEFDPNVEDQVPLGQISHEEVPSKRENLPAGQAWQSSSEVAATLGPYVPAGHLVQVAEMDAPTVLDHLPVGQAILVSDEGLP